MSRGVPFTTGAGQIYVHWTSADIDQHYIADLGCDYKRNESRNKALLSIVKGFSLPLQS